LQKLGGGKSFGTLSKIEKKIKIKNLLFSPAHQRDRNGWLSERDRQGSRSAASLFIGHGQFANFITPSHNEVRFRTEATAASALSFPPSVLFQLDFSTLSKLRDLSAFQRGSAMNLGTVLLFVM